MDEDHAYLLDLLFEIGPTSYVGMGEVPLTEFDILCWRMNRDGRKLHEWEIKALREMSGAYLAGQNEGQYLDSVAPFRDNSPEAVNRREMALAKKIKEQFKKGK